MSVTTNEFNLDITEDLETLQFDSALSAEEKKLLYLRKRVLALTFSACAQAVYFSSIYSETRLIHAQLRDPDHKRASRLITDDTPKDPLVVGIIGCGRLGRHIANSLLDFGEISSEHLRISTRRPETLTDFAEKGVLCTYDNALLARSSHLLFICVLPSQLPLVAEEIKGLVPKSCVVYSLVSATPIARIQRMFNTPNVVRPCFKYNENCAESNTWDKDLNLLAFFERPELVALSSPLYPKADDILVATESQFAEIMIKAFLNVCAAFKMTVGETVDVANAVFLGHSLTQEQMTLFSKSDLFPEGLNSDSMTPEVSMPKPRDENSKLLQKLIDDSDLRTAFNTRYCNIFSQYIAWKNTALGQLRKK